MGKKFCRASLNPNRPCTSFKEFLLQLLDALYTSEFQQMEPIALLCLLSFKEEETLNFFRCTSP